MWENSDTLACQLNYNKGEKQASVVIRIFMSTEKGNLREQDILPALENVISHAWVAPRAMISKNVRGLMQSEMLPALFGQ